MSLYVEGSFIVHKTEKKRVILKEAILLQEASILSYPGQTILITHIANLTFVLCQDEESHIVDNLVSKSYRADD